MKPKIWFFLFALSLLVLSSGNLGMVYSADDDILSPGGDDDIVSPGGDGSDDDIISPGGDGSDGDIISPGGGSGGVDCSVPDADVLFPDECALPPVVSPDDGVVDCSVPDADILFPVECGGFGGVDCSVPDAAILFPVDCAIPPVAPPVEPEPPVAPANNPPLISAFSVPVAADKNTDVTLTVAATDNDGGVNRIEILSGGVVVATQPCGNIVSCAKSFIVRVPDAFSAVYTFIARVFDNLGAVATASGSGVTNPAPAAPPAVPVPEEPRKAVAVSIPSDELFISTLVPNTGCLSPGDETFLYISLKNTGKRALDDVKITAIVLDADIRAVSGPFSIRKGDSASRFLYFIVPENAKPGEYYIKVSVTFGTDSVVKYRIFEVSRAC